MPSDLGTPGDGDGKLGKRVVDAAVDATGLVGVGGDWGGGSSPFRYDSLSRHLKSFSTKAVVSTQLELYLGDQN